MSGRIVRTIGDLIERLSDLDPTLAVSIDNRPPTALSSWRGVYHDLAIERSEVRHERTELVKPNPGFDSDILGHYQPGSKKVRIKADPTVGDLLEALRLADGATFEGYKGGQFYMDCDSDIWVAEYGDATSDRIYAISTLPGRIDLLTVDVDPW